MEKFRAHISIPDIGLSGQNSLKRAKIMVIGAGGLGCPVLLYLAAAGIDSIGIIDNDKVDIANLHRQIIFTEDDIGKPKALIVSEKLKNANKDLTIFSYNERLDENNATSLFTDFDLIIDCSDNLATRFVIDQACTTLNKPWIFATVGGFEGMVTVFNFNKGYKFKDLYSHQTTYSMPNSCSESGILGSTCAYAASIQVNEAIKIITGIDHILEGKILTFNLRNHVHRTLNLRKTNT